MYYVLVIRTLSSGSLDKSLTSYDNKDTALRKYHEAFNVIGGGPKRISSMLLRDVLAPEGIVGLETILTETWVLEETPEPEPEPEEEITPEG